MMTFYKIIAVLGVPAFFLLTLGVHPVVGAIIWVALILGLLWAFSTYYNARVLAEASERVEPRFVISRNPKTGERVSIPEELEPFVIHVKYRDVAATVERQKTLLRDAGNGFEANEAPEDRLPVEAIIFRDGKHVHESWDDFRYRAVKKILKVRETWHERLRKNDRAHYMKFHHRQRSFEWELSGTGN